MVMVVADAILDGPVTRGRCRRGPRDQDAERVVHRLERDRADLGSDDVGHGVGCDVGLARDRPQDSQTLGRDLDAALAEEVCGVRHVLAD
jgi:hypothetical protein